MYIAICDSDVTVRREVKRIIKEKYNDVTVDEITGLQEYCINLCKQTRKIPDIIIVDVRWEKSAAYDTDGIGAVVSLQILHPEIKVIFLTGFIHYASDVFELEPSTYLTKSIEKKKLMDVFDKAYLEIVQEDKEVILFQDKKAVMRIKTKDILYLESNLHELIFHMRNGDKKRVWMKMDEIMKQLPDHFVRIHQSYSVNIRYLIRINRTRGILSDGTELPVSRSRYINAKKTLSEYLGEKTPD